MVRRLRWVGLIVLALLSFASFAVPMYVIRPFRHQDAAELAFALVVRRWAPAVATICALCSLTLVLYSWDGLKWKSRTLLGATLTLTCLFAVLTHVNVYELMFHPVGVPDFLPAAQAGIDSDDMVLVVKVSGEARAYPIRTMGYHHIVNDWVGGVPIAATY